MKVWTETTIESVADLQKRAWVDNPRKMTAQARAALDASLGKFGLSIPLVVNKTTDTLLSGHQRLRSAMNNGAGEIPVLWVELDAFEEEALALVLNNPSAQGEWDNDKLLPLVERIRERGAESVSATGFSERDISRLVMAARASQPMIAPKMPPPGILSPQAEAHPPILRNREVGPSPQTQAKMVDNRVIFSLSLPESIINWLKEVLGENENEKGETLARIAKSYLGASL